MGRRKIRDIRNEELISATISAAYENGFGNITLADVAREAGASPASVTYYFGTKEQLMCAAMLRLMNLLRDALLRRLQTAQTAHDRFLAVIDANFDESLFVLEQCSMWIQFWSQAPYSAPLSRLHQINRSRVRSNFRSELKQLLPPESRETARRAIQAYMDGVWIEAVQQNQKLNAASARAEARRFVEMILSSPESLVRKKIGSNPKAEEE